MDPLRIITKYNTRRLSETLISSFLNYFLDPLEDHGLGYTFLARYLDALGLVKNEREFWSNANAPSVVVRSELTLPNAAGRIDSLVWVRRGRKVWIAATEVKIHDSSAKNLSSDGAAQLDRYYNALESLDEQRFTELLSVNTDERIQIEKMVFSYLVPSESKQWRQEVQNLLERAPKAARSGGGPIEFRILPWAQAKDLSMSDDAKMDVFFAECSLEKLIRSVLEDQSLGAVPQPDDHALHLLRCIRNAALNDFRYVFPSRTYDAIFPDHEQFVGALKDNDQGEVLEAVMVASGTTRKANPLHTAIGIPVTVPKDPRLSSNSLLAIRTTETYSNPAPLEVVEIEFDARTYDEGVISLQDMIDSTLLPSSNVFEPSGLILRSGVHPDANEESEKSQTKVMILRLVKGVSFDTETATSMLTEFFDRLRAERFNVVRRIDSKGQAVFERRA